MAPQHGTPPPPQLVVLITGAGEGGIGNALAGVLAASGTNCRVIATARNSKTQLAALKTLPNVAAVLDLDVTSQKSIEACRKAVDRLTDGRGIDVLVNNAGVNVKGTLLDSDMAAIERCFAVNVLSVLAVTKAFTPQMARRRMGLVVNVGSVAGYVYGPVECAYSASKNAVRALTDGLRVELAPLGVKVMLVAPGFVKTRIDDEREGSAAKMWFPPLTSRASGRGSGGGAASDGSGGGSGGGNGSGGGPSSSSSSSSSPYALYDWLGRVVRTSIFELGPGCISDSPEAFAARLAKVIVAEAPRAPRPVPLSSLRQARQEAAVVAAAAKADKAAVVDKAAAGASLRKRGAAAAAAPPSAAPAPAPPPPFPAPPPAALDMLCAWRWWAPHLLGGPLRHYRAAPSAGLTWLVGALAPLWLVDLALGLYMGFWTVL